MRETRDLAFYTDDRRFVLELSGERLGEILAFCRKSNPKETGGLLIGRYSERRDLATVSHVTGPARDSSSGRTWFNRGVAGLQELLSRLSRKQEYYLGEWHSHPLASPFPSGVDGHQMRSISQAPNYQCPEPILLIVGGDPWGEWLLQARVYPRGAAPQDMRVEV